VKKVLLFILLIIVLVGCNAYNDVTTNTPIENSSSNETESMSIEVNEVETKDDEAEKRTFNYEIKSVTNGISVNPHTVYYNAAGELVVIGYIENEVDYTITTIRMSKLEIYNENDELIAKDAIGYLYDDFIEAKGNLEWTFVFPAITVSIKDDDLDNIHTVTTSSSKYY